MLAGLRHHPLIRSDNEEGGIDASDAGQHVADEVNVPWHIDNAHGFAARKRKPGKTEIDGHLSGLLFGQSIWVNA
jgi:hypothetical protein